MFQKILMLGAGLSSHYLIEYLHTKSLNFNWQIGLADSSSSLLAQKKALFPQLATHLLDINQAEEAQDLFQKYQVVVSLLPAFLQPLVAKYCLQMQCHLLTASYLPPEIQAMEAEVKQKGLFFLNEMGLDPGLDHLSACAFIQAIKQKGGKIHTFRSFAGALVAPESEDNPWQYKFTWNPLNVVKAGQGGMAQLFKNGTKQYIPYWQLFKRLQHIEIEGVGDFEAYPNRDSLKYQQAYQLEDAHTIERGTLRRKGFAQAWDLLIQLGLTNDEILIDIHSQMTYRDFTLRFIDPSSSKNDLENLSEYLNTNMKEDAFQKILWLGLLSEQKIELEKATPAQVLLHLLSEKWALQATDKDMIVMQHQIGYTLDNKNYLFEADLVVKGENAQHTAIAKTVGLPLAIATKLLMEGKIKQSGVFIPTLPELYEPVLEELKLYGIEFQIK